MKKTILLTSLLTIFILSAVAQIKLPQLVRDSMVLQRDAPVKIWGWAAPKEKIRISFQNKKYNAAADLNGKWIVVLPPMKAGGPFTMDIAASNKITLKEILIGDVWFCSGQSNMVHQMILHNILYEKEIAQASNALIRHFWIPTMTDLNGPRENLPSGFWKSANPEDINQFSAVAYFFALKIFEQHQVPIGLINASVGGTPIEAWTSEEGLKDFSAIVNTIQKNKDTGYINSTNRISAAYNAANRPKKETDKGLTEPVKWHESAFVPKNWRTITVPGYWEDQGVKDLNGVVWYRKEIELPKSMEGKPAKVFLGRIVDADVLYINGKQVGNTTYQYPQRRYNVPEGLLKAGKNLFVVRVINTSGKGGFVPDKPYCLFAGKDTIDLKGDWQYKVGDVFVPTTPGPAAISFQHQPNALYNAMVAPLINFPIKGILWYQGESNAGRPAEYANLLTALIADWRNKWKQPDAPFVYAQLPGFMDVDYLPSSTNWALLREAQLKALVVPNTAMTVNIDLGEWNDIHPDNKKDVGERMALAARKIAYGENIVHSGPLFQSAEMEGNKIIITFSNTGTGLVSKDGMELSEFAIAGADKKFVWAKAKIEGNTVVVWNDDLKNPLHVRYAWSDNPDNPNLFNKEDLPASPFRTDIPIR